MPLSEWCMSMCSLKLHFQVYMEIQGSIVSVPVCCWRQPLNAPAHLIHRPITLREAHICQGVRLHGKKGRLSNTCRKGVQSGSQVMLHTHTAKFHMLHGPCLSILTSYVGHWQLCNRDNLSQSGTPETPKPSEGEMWYRWALQLDLPGHAHPSSLQPS